MGNLFSDAANERLPDTAPLAMRMRPQKLEHFVGQEQVLGPQSVLRVAIEEDRVGSSILYGPPGSGKTTLARVIANTTGAAFEELSAVSATVAQVREVLKAGRERLGAQGQRTILFLDEIHRFNKAQQDALLPAVEEGTVTLIGATTENPYFEVNSALLSRSQIYELVPLSDEELVVIVRRGAEELKAEVPDELAELIARRAGGDARNALNILELASQTATVQGQALDVSHVEDASRKRPLVYDKGGDAHYDFVSAFIKSMRASDPDASVYYVAAMLAGGEDPRFIARRMVIFASEDVGNADPRALLVAVAAAHAVEHVGLPEVQLNLAQAAIYLARAPKSNAVITALKEAQADVKEHGHVRPPDSLRDAHYYGAKKLGRGKGYIYPHSDPRGFEVDNLPEPLKGKKYYRPSGSGEEGRTMATEKTARATWEGTLAEGKGRFSLGSGAVTDQEVTWKDRAEDGGGTSPEELIAAAHASCILMALAGGLAKAHTPPTKLESEARATFDKVGEGFKMTKIELSIRGEVEGIDDEAFQQAAEGAKENCPVSQALKGNVELTLDAALL